MKALTIKNPWAHLIAIGVKDVENRSWKTNFRGTIYIHSSQKIDSRYRDMSALFTYDQYNALSIKEQTLAVSGLYKSSAIIGEVEIVDCIQHSESIWAEPGQWHWILKNAKLYTHPFLNVKGKLSFWEFNQPNIKQ